MNGNQLFVLVSVALSLAMCPSTVAKTLSTKAWIVFANQATCYYYQKDQLASTKPCKLSFTNKIGLQTLRMDWSDQTRIGVEKLTKCDFIAKPTFTADGYCRFFVNGRRALRYHRSSTQFTQLGHVIDEQGDMTCYQVKATGNSVCTKAY
jgi:hypothetical protein